MFRLRSVTVALVAVAVALLAGLAVAAPSQARGGAERVEHPTVIRVWHGVVAPTSVNGSGLGAVRTYFVPIAVNGASAADQYMTGTLTTVAIDSASNTEWRTANLVYVLGSLDDQVVLGGVSTYPAAAGTLAVGATATRPIVGGSGKYAGAHGYAVSKNLGTGGWLHVLHLLN